MKLSGVLANDTAGWQPIETGPKDRTELLLWNGEHRVCSFWSRDDLDPERTSQGWVTDICDLKEPTHWMPLPSPPER